MIRTLLLSASSALLVAATALTAGAAPPTFETETIDEVFYDDFVSNECGVDVWGHAQGHAKIRSHGQEGSGLLDALTINITLTLTSEHGSYKMKDVGTDKTMRTPDGSIEISVVGQVPFGHKGLFRFNPDTGEVLHEPQRTTGDEILKVCEALAP